MAAWPASPNPGEIVTVAVGLPGGDPPPRLELRRPDGSLLAQAPAFVLAGPDGRRLAVALLAVPADAAAGPVLAMPAGRPEAAVVLTVQTRAFVREDIPLDAAGTALRVDENARKNAEADELWAILVRVDPNALWAEGAFAPPVESQRRTSGYGDRRRYLYADGSVAFALHYGIDYGVPIGTPVRAAARGRVVLAKERLVTGNSVVLEHYPGVFSLYYHLDRLDVGVGAVVAAGQAIGVSGSTGLSTGPHLHYEVRAAGVAADPDLAASRSLLDKTELFAQIDRNYDRRPEGR